MKRAIRFWLVALVIAGLGLRRWHGCREQRRPRSQGLGDDHGVGGGVADRGVHEDGRRLPEAEPGYDGHVQLRGIVRTLVTQIQGGAPADVFASADGANMQKLVTGGQVTAEPTVFASNLLTIVVKPGNPKNVKSLADLADARASCRCVRRAVPCGKYADQILTQAGVTIPTGRRSRAVPT